jgi:hypothetical protein
MLMYRNTDVYSWIHKNDSSCLVWINSTPLKICKYNMLK